MEREIERKEDDEEEGDAITCAIASDKEGLHNNNHLLGVIPLVLFWNFSGHNS